MATKRPRKETTETTKEERMERIVRDYEAALDMERRAFELKEDVNRALIVELTAGHGTMKGALLVDGYICSADECALVRYVDKHGYRMRNHGIRFFYCTYKDIGYWIPILIGDPPVTVARLLFFLHRHKAEELTLTADGVPLAWNDRLPADAQLATTVLEEPMVLGVCTDPGQQAEGQSPCDGKCSRPMCKNYWENTWENTWEPYWPSS